RELYNERAAIMEDPPKQSFRLAPGREVRLRYAYLVTCEEVIKDAETGEVVEVICRYDPASRGGNAPDGRKVKGTLHWVSARHAVEAEVRLYDRLFSIPNPRVSKDQDFTELLNPRSLDVLRGCMLEPELATTDPDVRYQFERLGYFAPDPVDSRTGKPAFNRIVTLRDAWARLEKQQRQYMST
ncbi:MAG: glutamine--tRNA ligase, partial [Pseudomonadota bacterium]|nr:glutamine--tRNA ligase [Pseudomonadota bacterium]